MFFNKLLTHKARYMAYMLVLIMLSSYVSLSAQFTEVTANLGGMWQGSVVWGDYDNDGDLDILMCGATRTSRTAVIFRNDNDTFVAVNAGLTPVSGAMADWGDYDNDGDLDILIYGRDVNYNYLSRIHRNNSGTFENINADLPTADYHPAGWIDFDKDGDLDIYLTGNGVKIYRNENGNFTDIGEVIPGAGDVSWVDYDNDGDMDAVHNNPFPSIFRNDNGVFVEIETLFPTGVSGSPIWGDYDNDGDLDILMVNNQICRLLRNDAGLFVNSNINLPGADVGYWGDYDNDGDLDVLLSGSSSSNSYLSEVYRNDAGVFTAINAGLISPYLGMGAWGDYDNDGDLDILISGYLPYSHTVVAKLYRNDCTIANTPPSAPVLSMDIVTGDLIAQGAIDDTTPSDALNYNLRIGTSSGGIDVKSPMSDSTTGYRRIVTSGEKNIRSNDLMPEHTYYVAAQSIDNGFSGSPFSNEITFTTPPIQLSYPNGGENLVSGSTSYIRWNANYVWLVKLMFSTDNGNNWVDLAIEPVPSAPGFYYYTVPLANSAQCKVKIAWAKDETFNDISDQTFSITISVSAPQVTVVEPSATGIYTSPGAQCPIIWSSQNLSAVSIDYTIDNGFSWNQIAQNLPSIPASFTWTIPDMVSNQARIRIRKADNPNCYDISDNTFTICQISLISPDGGEFITGDYSGNNTQLITWNAPDVTNLNLSYSIDNGNTWTLITTLPGSLGQYAWSIPAIESSLCRIKATHCMASTITDMSDTNFTIRVPVKFINANGGGFVNNNCDYTLRWKNIDITPTAQVHLEYSPDNSTWSRINDTAVPVTNLSHSFFLDLGTAAQAWFRMAEINTNRIVAKSAGAMTVTGKTLHLTSPQIGELIGIDSYKTISWTANGCTNLSISYTSDYGNSWIPIVSNIPSTQLSYIWHVPNTASTQCRIKLQDTTYAYMNIESDGEFSIIPTTFVASFTASPTTGYSDLEVQFTDQSVGYINSWSWDFNNDGQIDSHEQNPVYIYRQGGVYTVSLTISYGSNNVSITRSNFIYVLPMTADFSASGTGDCVPFTVQYTDLTPSDVNQWAWDFNNDGIADSNDQNPFWTYLFPGIYTVKLSVSNGLDSDTETKASYITVSLDPTHTLYVPTQYLTIQAAIDAAVDGDYIIVADGIYYENLVLIGKSITIGSYYFVDGDTTHISSTVIDGGQSTDPDEGSVITMLPGAGRPITSPHICGFTIRNGTGRRILQNVGGNTVEKRVGGGIYINQTNPMFTQNKIVDNDAEDEGGGSYAFQSLPNLGGTVSVGVVNPGGNTFLRNQADIGKDLYVYGSTTRDVVQIRNCDFEVFNQADTTLSNYWATSAAPLSFEGSAGRQNVITSDIYVSTDGDDALNTGLSADNPFKTIDHALSRAFGTQDNPVTIHIAPGIYSPNYTEESFPLQMVNWVSLQGAGTDETIIDAEANAEFPSRVIACDKALGVSLNNLTITGGYVTTIKNYHGGGIGATDSQLTINNSLLTNNSSAGDGAGLYILNSIATIDSVSFDTNSALGSGGGTFSSASNLNLLNSTYSLNTCNKNGAGVFADNGQVHIEACDLQNNQANGSLSNGGGISISSTTNAIIRNTLLKSNNAKYGAGIYSQSNTNLTIDRNRIINNLAATQGGGLFCNSTTGNVTSNLLANNTASQRGGGIYTYSAINLTNNTISNNRATTQGGGMYLNAVSPTLRNTILWGNTSGSGNQVYLSGASAPAFYYSDVQGGSAAFAGTAFSGVYQNNLNINPLYTAPTTGVGSSYNALTADFCLQTTSPCINTGDPDTNISQLLFDLAGYDRLSGDYIDIGAYEYQFIINLDAPQNVSIGIENGQLNLHWDMVMGANSYRIFASDNPTGAFTNELLMSSGVLSINNNRYTWTKPFADLPKQFYQVKASTTVQREERNK